MHLLLTATTQLCQYVENSGTLMTTFSPEQRLADIFFSEVGVVPNANLQWLRVLNQISKTSS